MVARSTGAQAGAETPKRRASRESSTTLSRPASSEPAAGIPAAVKGARKRDGPGGYLE